MAKKRSTSRRPPKTSQSGNAAKKKAWTVMVYMAAGKDLQTELAAIADIKEMEAADTTNVNVVVLLDREWPELPQLYRIVNGMSVPICPGKLADEAYSRLLVQTRKQARGTSPKSNTGDPQALIDFIDWVLADRAGKDEHFFLVLWGHNFGLGFGRDHKDPLTLPELKDALAKFGEGKLTMLGANTCAMSYAEAAFELQASADYLVASQTAVPLTGWPYTTILSRIAADPQIEPRALGGQIVVDFVTSLEGDDASMTLLYLKEANLLSEPVKDLAAALTNALKNEKTKDQVVDAFLDTAHGDVRPLVDLVDLCTNLSSVSDDAVQVAARALQKVTAVQGKLVLEHKSDPKLKGLHGLGIFAPGVTGEADLERLEVSEKSYEDLKLVNPKDNAWSRVAFRQLQKDLRPMQQSVAEFVRNAGASSREDRTGLAQLVVSIDRTFKKLDRALTATKQTIKNAIYEVGGASDARTSLTLPPRFGPPYLLLSDGLPAPDRPAKKLSAAPSKGTSSVLASVAESLANLEHALGEAERTARRVLTHSRLGLGDDPDAKPGILGDDPDAKPGILGDDPDAKPGILGDDPDAKPGILGLLNGSDVGRSQSRRSGNGLVEMYASVALSLRLVEESVSRLEEVVRSGLTLSATDPDVQGIVWKQAERALREVEEMITNARLVTRNVMVDPADGMGPGTQSSIRGAGREQLAVAGGLSSRFLRLL